MHASSTSSITSRLFGIFSTALLCASLAACGGGGSSADSGNPPPPPPPSFKPELSLIAGNIGGPGNIDGMGVEARFQRVQGIATGATGNVYIADTGNFTVRKIAPNGLVTTIAGKAGVFGYEGGARANARFYNLSAIAVDATGNTYVVDSSQSQSLRKIAADGFVTTLAGNSAVRNDGTARDGVGAVANFGNMTSIAVDAQGNVYGTDRATIRKITSAGEVTTPFTLSKPATGIAIDKAGNLFVLIDELREIVKITPSGNRSSIPVPLGPDQPLFEFASGKLALDQVGNLYLIDKSQSAMRLIKVDPSGNVTTVAQILNTLIEDPAGLVFANGIAADNNGNLFVFDSSRPIVQKITPSGAISVFAGAEAVFRDVDGTGATAQFGSVPTGITADSAGNMYVANPNSFTIRKITQSGVVATYAGVPNVRGTADGSNTSAQFFSPKGVEVDQAGNLYVTDITYQLVDAIFPHSSIRKITPGGAVTTFVGSAGVGREYLVNVDGIGTAARVANPDGIVIDKSGTLFIADSGNQTIRKITSAGVVTTLAGTPLAVSGGNATSVDGTGAAARFDNLNGLTIDGAGNLFVMDGSDQNQTMLLRKITPEGIVTTIAGGAFGNVDGKGRDARFAVNRHGLAADTAGNVYVADTFNNSIRKITPDGVVTTIVGAGKGIRLGTTSPSLDSPTALKFIAPNILAITAHGSVLKLTAQ